MAGAPASTDMGDNEADIEPGDPILDAVDDVFEPRPPSYPTAKPSGEGPGESEPISLPSRARAGRTGSGSVGPSETERPGTGSLFGPSPAERRDRLSRLLSRGIAPGEVETVARVLTSDPDPEVRRLAARGLAASGHRVPLQLLATALADPQDRVRREVVLLAAARGHDTIRLLFPQATDRRWPMAQQATLQVLPELVRRAGGLGAPDLSGFLSSVASLDPPPLLAERPGLAAVARALGRGALSAALAERDIRRIGAARLLSLSGLPGWERALADLQQDPSSEIRSLAGSAARALRAGREPAVEPETRSVLLEPGGGQGVDGGVGTVVAEPVLIASLARALGDPGEPVRAQARAALGKVRPDLVTAWAVRSLELGTGETPELAALVTGRLGLTSAATGLLQRAAAAPPEARGPYLAALQALALEPSELAGLVSAVDPAHRQAAVRLAWQVGGHDLVPHLASLLKDSAGPVRMAVIEVLAESGDPGAAAVARERLAADSSAAVRATAIHALAGSDPATRREALTHALSDPDPDVRATAVEALPIDAEEMAELLLPAFQDQDERVWRAALPQLAATPRGALTLTWSALRDAPPARREELIQAIDAADPGRLVELAAANARSSSPEERVLTVELASRAGTPEATALVVAALEDPHPTVRRTAASAMTTLRAPAAVPALSRSLSDPQAEVRVEAVRALGLIDDDTVPGVLIAALSDPEVRVREMAADALTRWHSPAVAARLATALAEPDLRRPAGDVLERMGRLAVEALASVAAGSDPEASAAAGALLHRIVGPEPFAGRLASIEPDERLRAARVLGALGGRTAAEALIPALSDPDVRVRSQAAGALGALGYLPALKQLRRMFLTDPVAEAAGAAEAALRALGAVPPQGDEIATIPDPDDIEPPRD
jgi:HEAT repeat protein